MVIKIFNATCTTCGTRYKYSERPTMISSSACPKCYSEHVNYLRDDYKLYNINNPRDDN